MEMVTKERKVDSAYEEQIIAGVMPFNKQEGKDLVQRRRPDLRWLVNGPFML